MQLKYNTNKPIDELAPYELPYNERAWSHYDEAMKEAPLISPETDFYLKKEKEKEKASCSCGCGTCGDKTDKKLNDQQKLILSAIVGYFLLG